MAGSAASRRSGVEPTLPITWAAMQMHHSDYRNVCGLGLVHDAEWKSLDKAAPDRVAHEHAARVWMSNNLAQDAFHLPNKVCTQTRGASFVEPGGCDKFAFLARV